MGETIGVLRMPAAVVELGDEQHAASGPEHAIDLTQAGRQILPPEMRLDRRYEIERVVRERQIGDGCLLNVDATRPDQFSIRTPGRVDAFLGMVDSEDLSTACGRRQFRHCPATATANVENRVPIVYWRMLQTPVREFRVSPVHRPENESAKPSSGTLALRRRLPRLGASDGNDGHGD